MRRQARDLDVPAAADVVQRLLDARRIGPLLVGHQHLEVRATKRGTGYASAVTSMPRFRAASMSATTSGALPHTPTVPSLMCVICTGSLRLLADGDGLADRLERAVRFVANVRDVEAAVPRGHARQRHELLGRCVAADLVFETRRETDRAVGMA